HVRGGAGARTRAVLNGEVIAERHTGDGRVGRSGHGDFEARAHGGTGIHVGILDTGHGRLVIPWDEGVVHRFEDNDLATGAYRRREAVVSSLRAVGAHAYT